MLLGVEPMLLGVVPMLLGGCAKSRSGCDDVLTVLYAGKKT